MKTTAVLFMIFLCIACQSYGQTEQDAGLSKQETQKDNPPARTGKPSQTKIIIPAKDHKISWAQIADAVVRESGIQIPAFAHVPAHGLIDLEHRATRWSIIGINMAMLPAIKISIGRDAKSVLVDIDNEQTDALRDRIGRKLRNLRTKRDTNDREYKIAALDADRSLESAENLVIVIHGFNSDPSKFTALCQAIAKSGKSIVGTFHYPSGEGVASAAKRLQEELNRIISANPDCKISFVTHSAGGLVARFVLEAPDYKHKQISQLIMIAPPNHGTYLASLPTGRNHFGSQSFQETIVRIDRPKIRAALQLIAGEFNVAIEDLRPNSEVLDELDSFKRNPEIKYSIILGRRSVFSKLQAAALIAFANSIRTERGQADEIGKEVSVVLKKLSGELVSPNGDGVVSIESGSLQGVDDLSTLEFRHCDISRDGKDEQKLIIDLVLKKLAR